VFAGCVTETPPAAAVRGMETVAEDLFEPEAEPEPEEAAREADADCEDDMIRFDRLSVEDQVRDIDAFCIYTRKLLTGFGKVGEMMGSLRSYGRVRVIQTG
jgi:hypothetical protein